MKSNPAKKNAPPAAAAAATKKVANNKATTQKPLKAVTTIGAMKGGARGGKRESQAELQKRAQEISAILRKKYAEATCPLDFTNSFQLLIATILAAQCTDAAVNKATPALFKRFPSAKALAAAKPEGIQELVRGISFWAQKTKSIQATARVIAEQHGGEVPESMEELVELPGVGRKTANCVRGYAMGKPALVTDTHFIRVTGRLGLSTETSPDKIEMAVAALLPEKEWTKFSISITWHGRTICNARKPLCPECPVLKLCPFGQAAMKESK